MRTMKLFGILFGVLLVFSALTPKASADQWDKKTTITFSGPVDVSGHRLEAGTYVFKLADTDDRHIVQIFTGDEKHIIATIIAIPDYRITPKDKTVIKFSERADNAATMERDLPDAGIPIKAWFYPGDNFGQEFLVKPAPAVAVAENTTTTTTAVTSEATEPAPPPVVEEKTEEKKVETAEALPAPAPEVAQETTEPAPAPAPAEPAPAPTELPQTASSMPLIGLLGLISVGVGFSLRQFVKRMA